jgi:hypothetical protein
VEETSVPGENHQPVASHWPTLSHNIVSSTPRNEFLKHQKSMTSTDENLGFDFGLVQKCDGVE